MSDTNPPPKRSKPNAPACPVCCPPSCLCDERARRLHAEHPLVDGHNDLAWACARRLHKAKGPEERAAAALEHLDFAGDLSGEGFHTDIPRLRKGGVGVQFWSVYVPVPKSAKYGDVVASEADAVVQTLEQVDRVQRLVAKCPKVFELCDSPEAAREIYGRGKIASVMGAEGGHQIANSLGVLRVLHKLGVVYMTLTHNGGPAWADSALDAEGNINDEAAHGGLTAFGVSVVNEMNRIGMMVDLSHTHADTMQKALEASRAPCIFSHSGARGVCPHPRNVPDDVLPLVKSTGSVINCTFVSAFVSGPIRMNEGGRAVLSEVADHIVYIKEKIGIQHVGIGGDYDGCTELPDGLEDVSCYPALTAELLRRRFSDEDIALVMGGNMLRVWGEACKVGRKLQLQGAMPCIAAIE